MLRHIVLENTENSKQEQNKDKDTNSISTNSPSANSTNNTSSDTSHTPHPLEDTNFSRTGSERFRDGAKALLRRVESLKSRRRKRQNREGIVISGPQIADVWSMQQRMKDLNCLEIPSPALSADNSFEFNSPQSSPLPCSPVPSPRRPLISSPLHFQIPSLSSEFSMRKALVNRRGSVSFDRAREEIEAMSDSECQRLNGKFKHLHNSRSNKPNNDLVFRSVDKPDISIVHSSDYDSDLEEAEICNQSRYFKTLLIS